MAKEEVESAQQKAAERARNRAITATVGEIARIAPTRHGFDRRPLEAALRFAGIGIIDVVLKPGDKLLGSVYMAGGRRSARLEVESDGQGEHTMGRVYKHHHLEVASD